MNDIVANLNGLLARTEKSFEAKNDHQLNFMKECGFAKQQVMKTDFAIRTAQNNQQSLINAIQNVSAIGVSLNPALAHAYLVPRDGGIHLDMSYKGLIKLATDSGAILHAVAELIYEGDTFEWKGKLEKPSFSADVLNPDRQDIKDPFKNLKGAYCVATLPDGSAMCDYMTAAELEKIRNTSKASNGPWKTWPERMMLKAMLKRASNSWPQGSDRARFDKAVEVLNEHEGIEIEEKNVNDDYMQLSPEQKETLANLIKAGDANAFHVWYHSLDDRLKIAAYNEAPQGEKGKHKDLVKALDKTGRENLQNIANTLDDYIQGQDLDGAMEVAGELEDFEINYLKDRVSIESSRFLGEMA
jgi:recombination protein RecT